MGNAQMQIGVRQQKTAPTSHLRSYARRDGHPATMQSGSTTQIWGRDEGTVKNRSDEP
ncbi:Hypothetical protein FKW44_022117 [Caligus rogercresseyi]|uniref:Uncharacterized protein n=1 Tax=Caligus rogercresseyi TaxID=217165 RepID=A0A7T8GS95_CALRO|nr:Hypothetical protein FKW44_022117 [Caligus rogercresseyi]